MMEKRVCGLILLCVLAWAVSLSARGASSYADGAFFGPPASESAMQAVLHPIPQADVASYLSKVAVAHTFHDMEGLNEAAKAGAEDTPLLKVAHGYAVSLSGGDLFGAPFADGGRFVYLSQITSADAFALRLLVDLSGLAGDQELWVLDPTGLRAFGPYHAADQVQGGNWLATVMGDTATLMVRSTTAGTPKVALKAISHFFGSFDSVLGDPAEKELPCNVDIACETDPIIQQIASGVGMLLIPNGLETMAASGALVNVPATSEFEPYMLTANHVISTKAAAQNTDVIWDFRSSQCNGAAPSPALLPHSKGVDLLATDSTLDVTLIRLDSVPVSLQGRAYLGWDTRDPRVGEKVIVIHHPGAKHMRISYGRVQATNLAVSNYYHETRVGWDEGVTEPGSSGACMLYDDGTYRIGGTLTGGSSQTCSGTADQNWDFFSSFTRFYNDISPGYLTGATGYSSYHQPQAGEGEGEGEPTPTCIGASLDSGAPHGPSGGAWGDMLAFSFVATIFLSGGWRRARLIRAPHEP